MKDITHKGSYVAKFGDAADEAGSSPHNPVQALQAGSWKAHVKRAAVVQPSGNEGMDKGGGGSQSERAGDSTITVQLSRK